MRSDEGGIKANVQGTDLYEVVIEFLEEGEMDFYCTCPYTAQWGGPCKHAWATLLAAQRRGLLGDGEEFDDSDDSQIALPAT